MKVIDARSGKLMQIGDVVEYSDGEYLRLIDVDHGFFWASAIVEMGVIDHTKDELELEPLAKIVPIRYELAGLSVQPTASYRVVKPGPIVKIRREVPLVVRYMHPNFRFQHVAFIPS